MPSKSVEDKIQKEMEIFKLKFSDKEQEDLLEEIESRLKALRDKPNPDYKDEIWTKVYKDVLELKKKSKK
jgi:hypothetical protein